MESPETLDQPDEAPAQPNETQEDNAGDGREDFAHGVVGQVPGSDGKTRPRRPRGRHAKDPLAKSIVIKCSRLEDLEAQLKEYLADSTLDREHTTLEFDFPVTTAFMVAAREPLGKGDPGDKKTPYVYSPFNKTAITVVDALHTIQDPKERVTMQKGISKTLIEACQNVDGYRYSFHNHWISREDQASRFSYYCNDSVLNKGRAANESVTKIKAGVKVRKPVWDCHGLISIKFSMTKNSLELHYTHIPLHKTFEERAPNPRNGSKRKRLLEIFHPEKLVREKKRKSSEPKPSRPKKPVTEPTPHEDGPSTTPQREGSLAPLFDFLGRIEEDGEGPAATEPPAVAAAVDVETVKIPASGDGSKRKKNMFPGQFIWNISDPQKKKRQSKKTLTAPGVPAAPKPPVPPAATATPAPMIPPSSGQTVAPISRTESELRARLEQAEQKIRDLEAERQRQARGGAEPGRSTALQYQNQQGPLPPNPAVPYPPPPPNAYFPPPHFQYPPNPPQWNYPPHSYPYPYPPPGPPGPPSLPYPNPAPGSAPAATHPHAYHYPPQPLPPLSQQRPRSNPPPAYGFVPNPLDPMDPIPTRVRSHLGPPQTPLTPESSSTSRAERHVERQSPAQAPPSSTERHSGSSSPGPSASAPEPSDETVSATATAGPAQPAPEGEPTQAPISVSPTTTMVASPAANPDPSPTNAPDEK
nr:hypothetical protein CLAIMM_04214 [Cladophialophora immunda]